MIVPAVPLIVEVAVLPGALAIPETEAVVAAPAIVVPGVVLYVLGRGLGQGNCQREQQGSDEEAAALPHVDQVKISTVSSREGGRVERCVM